MRWQHLARIALAAIGIGLAAVIVVMTRRQPTPGAEPPNLATLDPNASLATGPGRYVRRDGGGSRVEIVYSASKRYDDGRMRFEGAEITGLDENKSKLRADVLETTGTSAKGDLANRFDLVGHVVLQTDDGLTLETERARYDDGLGLVNMPGQVAFRRGRLSGTGIGAQYDRAADTVTFQSQAVARVAPAPDGGGAAEASAARMMLARGQHTLRLEEQAKIVGDTETLLGDTATFSFTENEGAIKYLELRGRARVEPSAGAGAGQPAMSADGISMSFHPDGLTLQHATLTGQAVLTLKDGGRARSIRASWIDAFIAADGQTLTGLQARDRVIVELPASPSAPGRTITATSLQAKGDANHGLTSAKFDGSPRFEETPATAAKGRGVAPAKRAGTATVLVLTLGGQLDAIEKAEFQQNAKFENGNATAWADIATYDDAKDVLLLVPNPREPRRLSRVTTPDMTVDASAIDLFLESENLNARGAVTTRMTRSGAGRSGSPSSALFNDQEPVYGSAETLQYRKDTGTAIYIGTSKTQARLKQGQTEVVGNRIEFAEATSHLAAAGNVDSTMQLAASSDPAKPGLQSYRVRAETLTYDEGARNAIYQGPTVVLTTADGTIESQMLTLTFAEASRTLDRMRAEAPGVVYGRLSGGYEMLGDVLVYQADADTYTLTGRPAKVKAPEDSAGQPPTQSGCKLNTSLTLELNRRTGSVQVPGRGQAPRTTEVVPCATSIRPAK